MKRIITGIVGILILIPACIFSHTVIWPILVSVFSWIAVDEILECVGEKKDRPHALPARFFSLLPLLTWLLCHHFSAIDEYRCIFLFSGVFFLAELMVGVFTGNRLHSEKLYSLVGLVMYVVIAFTAISQIRFLDNGNREGAYLYLLIFLGAWISDTFAYFTGKAFGKTPLAPQLSPKKTVEGSMGGVVANMIGFAGYAVILRSAFCVNANFLFFAILGALFSAVGQFGDIFASCIKRHYGIKDYGVLFPGHGGVLDRFDSTLAIAMVMFLLNAAFGSAFLII